MVADLLHPWFTPQWERLLTQHRSNRLPHALLLSGAQGVGKHDFAQALANLLLCHQPTASGPCGHCHSCDLRIAGHHPDLVSITPEAIGKPIKVDQVRVLIDHLHSTAQQGGYRVVIMEPAEALNISSANALLKILEEPGDNTLLLLVCHQPGQLMPTIRSRCQRIDFVTPTPEQAQAWLSENLGLDTEKAQQLLRLCHGAPLKARRLYESDLLEQRKKLMTGLADLLRDRVAVTDLALQFGKFDLLQCLDWLNSLLSDIIRMQLANLPEPVVNPDMKSMLQAVAKRADSAKIFALADRIQEERVSLMLRHNPNRQLLLERLLLLWSDLARKT
ncbi:MAG: DNA polymerase III subunit delta' [Oceanospirillales bacterium]|uniref:DNA polymerase III subunit delta' n=1 Tax=Marinobacterium halophilum TaxID=267374 RepID=A0A2P8EKM0_9GAMM|nr:DNA polymerase III subunit delta' [Marinobacterium halophilum]MBR9828016.1 DNA polymerase III subunit delta' [Oceanospirillales bacterium]PSL09992.1 DNA polymerase-3 subunit delta' [Marinobacterium halophilum]